MQPTSRKRRFRALNRFPRHGAAVVELAVCMPVIFTVVFASIEACNMIALRQITQEAAYDGALAAMRPDATKSDVVADINTVLTAHNITPDDVQVTGNNGAAFASVKRGDRVIVTVDVATNGNVVGPQLFGAGRILTAASTAVKQ